MADFRVQLFGAFDVVHHGGTVQVPFETQRLVAFLALHEAALPRAFVAGALWCEGDDVRARANLRSTLWRLRQHVDALVVGDCHTLSLGAGVDADVRELRRRAARLWGTDGLGEVDVTDLDHRPFALEFLPGWYDEWVVVERERVRQLRLHCLESIAALLAERRMFGAAIQALLTSISLDPLRETPQRQLIAIHLAEGNRSEAVRQYDDFADTLHRELGFAPSTALRDLVGESVDAAPVWRRR